MAATLFGLTIFLLFVGFIAFVLRFIINARRKLKAAHIRAVNYQSVAGDDAKKSLANSASGFCYTPSKSDSWSSNSFDSLSNDSFGSWSTNCNPSTGLPMIGATDIGGHTYGG